MDACDEVMTKIGKPTGLIRISSYNAIAKGEKKLFTTRVKAYMAVLLVLVTVVTTLLLNRADIDATVLRVPGQLYQHTEDGRIQNLYNVTMLNKTFEEVEVELRIKNIPDAEILIVGGNNKITMAPNSTKELTMLVKLPPEAIKGAKTPIEFEIVKNGEVVATTTTNFLGPFKIGG